MSKFIEIANTAGRRVVINLDNILYVEDWHTYISIVYFVYPKNTVCVNTKMSLDEFLSLVKK